LQNESREVEMCYETRRRGVRKFVGYKLTETGRHLFKNVG